MILRGVFITWIQFNEKPLEVKYLKEKDIKEKSNKSYSKTFGKNYDINNPKGKFLDTLLILQETFNIYFKLIIKHSKKENFKIYQSYKSV